MNAERDKKIWVQMYSIIPFFLEITSSLKQLEDNDKSPRLVIKKAKKKNITHVYSQHGICT
jgi:hypothetical protein